MEERQLVVQSFEECDQIVVLRDGEQPNTLNLTSPEDELVIWRIHPTRPEVIGYIINAASVNDLKIVEALRKPEHIESVRELFELRLAESNRRLLQILTEVLASQARLERMKRPLVTPDLAPA